MEDISNTEKELITFLKDRSLKIQQQNKIKDFLLNVTFLQPFLKKGFLKKPNFCPSENLFLDNYFLIFNKEKYNGYVFILYDNLSIKVFEETQEILDLLENLKKFNPLNINYEIIKRAM